VHRVAYAKLLGGAVLTHLNFGFVTNAIRRKSPVVIEDLLIVDEELFFDGNILPRADITFKPCYCVGVVDDEVWVHEGTCHPDYLYRDLDHRAVVT